MDLRHLEIFCTVIEEGSFSKAGEALDLTQPTVSIHIKSLESDLSAKLIDRMGRKIQPTEAGNLLYKYGREIVRMKQDAIAAINDYTGNIKGNLTIAASTIPGEYILPEILSDFRKEFSTIIPILKINDSKNVFDMVVEGRADIGIIGEYIIDNGTTTEPFVDDEIILVAPKSFETKSLSKEDLKTLPFIVRGAGSGSRSTIVAALSSFDISLEDLNICAELGSTQAIIESLRNSMGLAFISRRAVKELLETSVINEVSLEGLPIKRVIYTVLNNMRTNSPINKTFIEFIKTYK